MKEQIDKAAKESVRQDLAVWEEEMKRLQSLAAIYANRETVLTLEIPALEEQIKQKEERLPALSKAAETVSMPLRRIFVTLIPLIGHRQVR